MFKEVPFEELVGLTISQIMGLESGSDLVSIGTTCGRKFRMTHHPECCETVEVNDVCGSAGSLIGAPVLYAEMTTNDDSGEKPKEYSDSWTWTFYRIGTINGTVVIRWLGESNGYYSESVDFEEESNADSL